MTAGEVEKISSKLEPLDQDVFKRWAERQSRGEYFGGEGTSPTVKIALLNQSQYEARLKIELTAANAQKVEADRVASEREKAIHEKQIQLEQIALRRGEVDSEIRKQFQAQAVGYELRPLTNNFGELLGKQFVFKLKLANSSAKKLIGAAGWVSVADVFGVDLGSYQLRIEPTIKPGQSIDYSVIMDYDKSNPKHYEITQAASIRIRWFFESVAFEDGTNIDYRSIASANAIVPPVKSQLKKSPSI